MKTLTFYDFRFRAKHSLCNGNGASAHSHWHSYAVRLWFNGSPDQDLLSEEIETANASLHGSDLNAIIPEETSDENLARLFLKKWKGRGCVMAQVTNDERRGAKAML